MLFLIFKLIHCISSVSECKVDESAGCSLEFCDAGTASGEIPKYFVGGNKKFTRTLFNDMDKDKKLQIIISETVPDIEDNFDQDWSVEGNLNHRIIVYCGSKDFSNLKTNTNLWYTVKVRKGVYQSKTFGGIAISDDENIDDICYVNNKIVTNCKDEPTKTRSPTESPAKTPTESPIETPTESPIETPTESPIETPAESPIETPAESPNETPTESPIETPAESPIETPAESPIETPTESPIETPTESPIETPTESPNETPTESPTKSPTESPIKTPAESPTKSPAESPIETPAESPNETPTESPTKSPTESPIKTPTKSPIETPTESPIETPETITKTYKSTQIGTPSELNTIQQSDFTSHIINEKPIINEQTSKKKKNSFIFLGIALAVVAVAVLLIIIFIVLKKRKTVEDNQTQNEMEIDNDIFEPTSIQRGNESLDYENPLYKQKDNADDPFEADISELI